MVAIKSVNMKSFGVNVEHRPDGSIILACPEPLAHLPNSIVEILRKRSEMHPDRDFLCEREEEGNWRRVTYDEMLKGANAIGQSLLKKGYGSARPLAILSDNSIDQALVTFGAMTVGMPVMPVSPAYSLMSEDHQKLKSVIDQNNPAVIFVERPDIFDRALSALDWSDRVLLTSKAKTTIKNSVTISEWLASGGGEEVEDEGFKINLETVGKILLTSGSTGLPKGVINTHRMMVSNQVAMAQVCPFLEEEAPILLDWLPWNHTFGGNYNLNMALYHGGTMYIDEGRPAPGRILATVQNLAEISPTVYLNVPRGFDLLLPLLEKNNAARDGLFRNLKMLFFAGAALPANVWERLDRLSVEVTGQRVPITTSLGSTETAPAGTFMNWMPKVVGNIGVPLPGNEVKLVPNGDKLEIRMRGPNITPGYYKQETLTKKAFDEENFFRIGDAGKFENSSNPSNGIVFDGRVAENFKLLTGTWVFVGQLRLDAIAAASPVIQDAVVTGLGYNEVGLLIFPSISGCNTIAGSDLNLHEITTNTKIHQYLETNIQKYNADNPGSSTCIKRLLLMEDPPKIDAGEITDKGYINQRAVLSCRGELVDRLYNGNDDDILVIS